jgi:hypothetical protein
MGIVFLIFLFTRKQNTRALLLIAFIGLGIGYNVYLDSEYLFHISQPNPDKVVKEMMAFVEQNNLARPIYTTDKGFLYYLGSYDKDYRITDGSLRIYDLGVLERNIAEKGGTIMYMRFSPYVEQEDILNLDSCDLLRKFKSKGISFGYVLSCNKS